MFKSVSGLQFTVPSTSRGRPRGPAVGAPPSAERQAEAMQPFREVDGPPAGSDDLE